MQSPGIVELSQHGIHGLKIIDELGQFHQIVGAGGLWQVDMLMGSGHIGVSLCRSRVPLGAETTMGALGVQNSADIHAYPIMEVKRVPHGMQNGVVTSAKPYPKVNRPNLMPFFLMQQPKTVKRLIINEL